MNITDDGSDRDRYVVVAAARGLEILDAMSATPEPLTLAEIVSRVGLPRPTVYRLVRTLQASGWVDRDDNRYRLGFKCFQLGAAAGGALEVRTVALPFLVRLRDRLGVSVQVAKLESWRVVYLERVLASGGMPPIMLSRAGAILPAHCTALGKVLLAHRSLEVVAKWASRTTLPRLTENTITDVATLLASLYEIRNRGYAIEEGERQTEVGCIAAPVRDYSGEVIAAMSASGLREQMPAQPIGSEMAQLVVETASDISKELGYVPNS